MSVILGTIAILALAGVLAIGLAESATAVCTNLGSTTG